MKETEATFWDAEHWRKDPVSQKAIAEIERLQARVAEEIASLESAIADVERLQSELNTALERVKVLEDGVVTLNAVLNELWGHKDSGYIARQMGLEMLDKIMAAQNNAYSCVSRETRDRAVLQSSGGK